MKWKRVTKSGDRVGEGSSTRAGRSMRNRKKIQVTRTQRPGRIVAMDEFTEVGGGVMVQSFEGEKTDFEFNALFNW